MPGETPDPNMIDASKGMPQNDGAAIKEELGNTNDERLAAIDSNLELQQATIEASRRLVDEREAEKRAYLDRPLAPGAITEVPDFGAPDKVLKGERKTGAYNIPDGPKVVSEITPDGMKQTRISGSGITKEGYAERTRQREQAAAEHRERVANQDPEYLKQFMRPE